MKTLSYFVQNTAYCYGCAGMRGFSFDAVKMLACVCLAAACAFVLALISVIVLGAVISVIICVIIITGDNRIRANNVSLV